MMILSIDLETTSLDESSCEIIEFGAALYDTESKQVVKTWSAIAHKTAEPLSEEVQQVTGITPEIMKRFGDYIWPVVYNCFDNQIDAIAAHNGSFFDRPILERFILECHAKSISEELHCLQPVNFSEHNFETPWIDTMVDIDFGPIKTRKLTYILAELNILQPYKHRALFDALSVVSLLRYYDDQIEALDLSHRITLFVDPKKESADHWKDNGGRWNRELNAMTVAGRYNPETWRSAREYIAASMLHISEAGFDEKEDVKARGFRWDNDRSVYYIFEPKGSYKFASIEVEDWNEYDEGLFITVSNARDYIDNDKVKAAGFHFFSPVKKWIKTTHLNSEFDVDFPTSFWKSEEALERWFSNDHGIRIRIEDNDIYPSGGIWLGTVFLNHIILNDFGSESADLVIIGFGASFESEVDNSEGFFAPEYKKDFYRFAYVETINQEKEEE